MAPLSFLLAASIPLARPSPTPSARRTESGAPDLPARLHRPAAAPPTPPAAASPSPPHPQALAPAGRRSCRARARRSKAAAPVAQRNRPAAGRPPSAAKEDESNTDILMLAAKKSPFAKMSINLATRKKKGLSNSPPPVCAIFIPRFALVNQECTPAKCTAP
ncbi:unnamed protein product [Urochloa humidicola]